jgi:hypothetical protein
MQSANVPIGTHNPVGHTAAEVLSGIQGRATYTTYDEENAEACMGIVVVDEGEVALLELMTSVDLYLRLFTNDVEDGLTAAQIEALTAADLTEASFTGYGAKTLDGGSWTVTAGDPSTATYTKQGFVSTIDQTPQTLYGYYVTRASDGTLCWYEYFSSTVSISGASEFVAITPGITLA